MAHRLSSRPTRAYLAGQSSAALSATLGSGEGRATTGLGLARVGVDSDPLTRTPDRHTCSVFLRIVGTGFGYGFQRVGFTPGDDQEPKTVRVPTAFDMFGNPTEFLECEPEAAGQYDPRRWRNHP